MSKYRMKTYINLQRIASEHGWPARHRVWLMLERMYKYAPDNAEILMGYTSMLSILPMVSNYD